MNQWCSGASVGSLREQIGSRPADLADQIGERSQRDGVAADGRGTPEVDRDTCRVAASLTTVVLPIPASPPTNTTDGSPWRASTIACSKNDQLRAAPDEVVDRRAMRRHAAKYHPSAELDVPALHVAEAHSQRPSF